MYIFASAVCSLIKRGRHCSRTWWHFSMSWWRTTKVKSKVSILEGLAMVRCWLTWCWGTCFGPHSSAAVIQWQGWNMTQNRMLVVHLCSNSAKTSAWTREREMMILFFFLCSLSTWDYYLFVLLLFCQVHGDYNICLPFFAFLFCSLCVLLMVCREKDNNLSSRFFLFLYYCYWSAERERLSFFVCFCL